MRRRACFFTRGLAGNAISQGMGPVCTVGLRGTAAPNCTNYVVQMWPSLACLGARYPYLFREHLPLHGRPEFVDAHGFTGRELWSANYFSAAKVCTLPERQRGTVPAVRREVTAFRHQVTHRQRPPSPGASDGREELKPPKRTPPAPRGEPALRTLPYDGANLSSVTCDVPQSLQSQPTTQGSPVQIPETQNELAGSAVPSCQKIACTPP